MMLPVWKRIETGPAEVTDEAIRIQWGESIDDFLATTIDPATGRPMTRKGFQLALRDRGHAVSLQTISMWINGQTAPRPSTMVAIAGVFNAPPRRVFPLEAAVIVRAA